MNTMNKTVISRFKAASMVKESLTEYYDNVVKIKVKPKIVRYDLYMIVKKYSKLNGKVISVTEVINREEIFEIIKRHYTDIESIMFDPCFNNLFIDYYNVSIINKQLIKTR